MRRREFITLLGGSATWPLAARAQQPAPVIGFLHAGSPEPNAKVIAAFRDGLSESGFVEGKNVAIEYRWAAGQLNLLPELAADLVRRKVAVIATPLSTQATLAAKTATMTIPIVFGSGADPVAMGLVASFSRPGGNITGVAFTTAQLGAKRVGLLHELLPSATQLTVLGNAHSALTEATVKDVQTNAGAVGMHVDAVYVSTDTEIEALFADIEQRHADALLIAPDEFFTSRMEKLAALSLHYHVPSTYVVSEFAEAGGLMSYGPDLANAYRETGIYTARVLKGEKPANLPVEQPTKFQFVINLKTAKALGLAVPPSLLSIADEVIE